MSCKCQVRVNSEGRYCCDLKQLTVRPGCVGEIRYTNLPETTVELEMTPDNWVPADPATIAGDGCAKFYKEGTYRINFDCEAIDSTEAPEEGAIGLCCDVDCYEEGDFGAVISAQLDALCEKIVAGDDAMAIAEIISQLEAICEKLLEQGSTQIEVLESLQALCEKIETGNEEQLTCLQDIKELLTCPPATARGVITTW